MNRSYKPIHSLRSAQNPINQVKPIQESFVRVETVDSQALLQQNQPVENSPMEAEESKAQVDVKSGQAETSANPEKTFKMVEFKANGKVSAKVKRLRANRRLRRLLCPKTAANALHELFNDNDVGRMGTAFQVSDVQVNGRFHATTEYNGKQYIGYGTSKQMAKNDVAENVLRDLVINKMRKCPKKEEKVTEENADEDMPDAEEDEVPMTHLASFALYKLFSEWAEQGFEVPDYDCFIHKPVAVSGNTEGLAKAKPEKDKHKDKQLPHNASSIHPVQLLQHMRTDVKYTTPGGPDLIVPTGVVHNMEVEVDGKKFFGSGKTKKSAKKEAARYACQELFGVVFNLEVLGN